MRHQSTVRAVELELAKRCVSNCVVNDDDPFVFGVSIVEGKVHVVDGGIDAFRADGNSYVAIMSCLS